MAQNEAVSYKEIHGYMIRKTQEYYQNPPEKLVMDVIAAYKAQGEEISYEIAKERVSLINIQRYLKQEMTEKWPEFMGGIPENSLSKTVD
ncbi:MAG: hypothetical protein J6V25_12965 [Oscillospiraceae bacterium]|nr:hypothetical protein [Oscillospiraceae bacterium]